MIKDFNKRITTLHSSSLCAFLFFSNISEENPLTLSLNGISIKFTDVMFEFKNIVIENSNPSNVDVVLTDKNNKNILFLECKFSEYLCNQGKSSKISTKYLDTYITKYVDHEKANLNIFDLNNDYFQIVNRNKGYIDGIKQMICHYMGIENLINEKYYNEKNNKQLNQIKNYINDANIYLGTILFDFSSRESSFEQYYTNYKNLYQNWYNYFEDKSRIKLLKEPLLYNNLLKDNKIPEKVISFYNLTN